MPGHAPRLLTAIALVVALAAAALPPAVHFALAYANLSATTETRAGYLAVELTRFISSNPSAWMYQQHRFEEIALRFPARDESLVVRAAGGERILQVGATPGRPALARSAPLHDSGTVVGTIEIECSMRPMLLATALAALAGLALGVAVFVTLRALQLRALEAASSAGSRN